MDSFLPCVSLFISVLFHIVLVSAAPANIWDFYKSPDFAGKAWESHGDLSTLSLEELGVVPPGPHPPLVQGHYPDHPTINTSYYSYNWTTNTTLNAAEKRSATYQYDGADYEWFSVLDSCRNDAVIARAKWRVRCRWNKLDIVKDFFGVQECVNKAPGPTRCCHGNTNGRCHSYWPSRTQRAWCRGWIPPEGPWQYQDQVCSCLWRKHCGRW